jgi:hypothetical protein
MIITHMYENCSSQVFWVTHTALFQDLVFLSMSFKHLRLWSSYHLWEGFKLPKSKNLALSPGSTTFQLCAVGHPHESEKYDYSTPAQDWGKKEMKWHLKYSTWHIANTHASQPFSEIISPAFVYQFSGPGSVLCQPWSNSFLWGHLRPPDFLLYKGRDYSLCFLVPILIMPDILQNLQWLQDLFPKEQQSLIAHHCRQKLNYDLPQSHRRAWETPVKWEW